MIHAASSIGGKSAVPRKNYRGRVQDRKLAKCKYKVSKGGKGDVIPPPPPTRRVESVEGKRQTMGIVPNLYYASEVAEKIYYSKEEQPVSVPVLYSAPAPTPIETQNWHYEYDGGYFDPATEYEICPEPSAMPSVSSVPSFHPTQRPSPSPSLSVSPSSSPSVSFKPTQISKAACTAILQGLVYTGTTDTHRIVKGQYYYEMVTDDGADIPSILASLDDILRQRVGPLLVQCGEYDSASTDVEGVDLSSTVTATAKSPYNARNLLESEKRFWGLEDNEERNLQLDGVDLGENDNLEKGECNSGVPVTNGESCNVYGGTYVLYIRDSGTSMADDEAKTNILSAIKKEMTGGNEGSLVTLIDGLEALNFLGDEYSSLTSTTIGKLTDGRDANVSSSLSSTGISLVAVGSLVTLLFLYAATRRRQSYKVQRIEEVFEDDESIFDKNGQMGGTDNMSGDSDVWRATRGAHVLGEDDSVFSDLESDNVMNDLRVAEKRRLYGIGGKTRYSQVGPREDDLGGTGDALNVHNCTSATCQICNNAGQSSPTFVPADLLSPISEVTCETELVTPKFTSPDTVDIDMEPRPYTSPDTIEM